MAKWHHLDTKTIRYIRKNSMNTATIKQHISPASTGRSGGDVRTFRKSVRVHKMPVISEQTRRTFEFISDPANAHLFTKEAARKAFAHVKI